VGNINKRSITLAHPDSYRDGSGAPALTVAEVSRSLIREVRAQYVPTSFNQIVQNTCLYKQRFLSKVQIPSYSNKERDLERPLDTKTTAMPVRSGRAYEKTLCCFYY
jgi:hypothetical protein